jgi:hypothetical protein
MQARAFSTFSIHTFHEVQAVTSFLLTDFLNIFPLPVLATQNGRDCRIAYTGPWEARILQ